MLWPQDFTVFKQMEMILQTRGKSPAVLPTHSSFQRAVTIILAPHRESRTRESEYV